MTSLLGQYRTTNLLEISEAPDFFAGMRRLVEGIASSTDEIELADRLRDAATRVGAEVSYFMTFVREDQSFDAYRLLQACDPVWGLEYGSTEGYLKDPWLEYAMAHSEPARGTEIACTSEAQLCLVQLAEKFGFRSVLVVPAVSVRPHPCEPGRWMLNFGARRLRASKLASKPDIPAFVDETFDSYDQVIENERREGLKPLEIALFIKRHLDRGHSRKDIARGIGKSPSYITVASALIDAPDWLMDAYRTGKCRGMFELCELRRLYEEDAAAVHAWLAGVDFVGRVELRRLKERVRGAEGFASASEGRAVAGQAAKSKRRLPVDPWQLGRPSTH